jgi:hypothetical protein
MPTQLKVEQATYTPTRVGFRRGVWKPSHGWTLRSSRQTRMLTGEGEMEWVAKCAIGLALLGVIPLILLVVIHYLLPDLPIFLVPLTK